MGKKPRRTGTDWLFPTTVKEAKANDDDDTELAEEVVGLVPQTIPIQAQ